MKLNEIIAEHLIAHRGGHRSGDEEIRYRCIHHDDTNPSASFNTEKGVFSCQGCYTKGHATQLAKDLGIPINGETNPRHTAGGYYDYQDSGGSLLYQVVRYYKKGAKAFYMRRPDGNGGWAKGLGNVKPGLYKLPELTKAIIDGKTIFIAEGEKDVNSLVNLGLAATCNPGGAGPKKWRDSYTPFLAGAAVVILPDNDTEGKNHSVNIAKKLSKVARSVRILDLPDLPAKGDVTDWITSGGTRDQLERLVEEAAVPFEAFESHEEVENPDGLPVIPLIGGELKWQVKQAEQAVLGAGVEVFQRAGVMVRPARVGKEETSGGIKIPSGSLLIVPVRQAWLRTEITASAKWIAYDKREKAWVSRNCPMEISEAYLDRAGDWKLPELAGVIECPTLRRDGSILSKNGYDKETGLYLNANVSVQIPDYSTKRDALRALDVLSEPFSEFPFASKEHRSVAISGVLTGVIRNSLMTAPAHGFDAPQAGSGKTLLADVIAMIVTGKPAAVMSQGVDEVEDEKRLDAMLMRGVGVITIDNSERPVGGQRICQVLTSEKVEARILGHSTVVCVPTNSLILCTGNNLAFAGDMTRRAIICRIEPRTERPDEREFNRDLYRWVPQNRERLVNAALTILSAYHLAGKPKKTYEIAGRLVSVKPYGRFEEWSDWVRGALLWLDQADPLETRGSIDSADPEKIKLQFVLDTWYAAFGGKAMLLREVIDLCTPPRQGLPLTAVYADLRDALLGVARKGNSIDSARLGYYLRSRKERVQGGACFYSDREKVSNSLLWRVNRL